MSIMVAMPMFAMAIAVPSAHAIDTNEAFGGDAVGTDATGEALGLSGSKDPRAIAASVIRVLLGFLGIVAVVIILIGGFKWMTANGEEGKIEEAQNYIRGGIIGLIIVLAAFGIAKFVMDAVIGAVQE